MIDWKTVFEHPVIRRALIQVFWAASWCFFGGYIAGRTQDLIGILIGCIACAFSGGSIVLALLNFRLAYREYNFRKKWGPK